MKMKVTDWIVQFLDQEKVTHVYEVVGGMITHLIDSIHKQGNIQLVSMHHEQAAAFAAEGMARMTGIPGVALATSGPGATNLLTGIGSCYFDSVPAVFITGQVNREEQRGRRAVRQVGFQETDIVSMAAPITKAAWQIDEPDDVPVMLQKAFHLAVSGRPGPVLLDIPMDVQRAEIAVGNIADAEEEQNIIDPEILAGLIDKMKNARRPLILAGGGINAARVPDLFRQFAAAVRIPVVNSLMAVDALSYGHPLRVGMIGTYGNRWANLAIGRADFLLVLGSRLDIRQTGSDTAAFKQNKIIYHVDCDAGEVNNRVTGCHPIIAQLRSFLQAILQKIDGQNMPDYGDWPDEIKELGNQWPDTLEQHDIRGINPNELMHQISGVSGEAAAFVVDVGQHQMWAAQSLELTGKQRFITTGGMGAMGFALPAAIGVALSRGRQPVVMIAGDGSFQLNLQELQTVVHHGLPLKMVIINNKCYGMVRQFQESYFDERYASTYWGYSVPDFGSIAKAFGIESDTIDSPDGIAGGLKKMWQNPHGPFLLQIMVDPFVNVFPKIAFGLPITEMEPFAKPKSMEST
jgi:acetolactate synthase-1/2/3 large subunit